MICSRRVVPERFSRDKLDEAGVEGGGYAGKGSHAHVQTLGAPQLVHQANHLQGK